VRASIVAVFLGVSLMGCAASNAQLRAVSSGHVGCSPDEIGIENYSLGLTTSSWAAVCRGKTFYCSGTDMLKDVGCAPR